MSLYKKILVAVDQTSEADEVVAAADAIAKQNNAELCMLTVIKPVSYAYSGYDAELIVLGTHCRRGLGLLLGSTANGVLHGAPCDVLTIRIDQ